MNLDNKAEFFRDKPMSDKSINIPNLMKISFCGTKLFVKKLECCYFELSNHDLLKVLEDFFQPTFIIIKRWAPV